MSQLVANAQITFKTEPEDLSSNLNFWKQIMSTYFNWR